MTLFSTRTIQSQLIIYFTVAILVPSVITSIVGVKLIQDQVIDRAESKLLSDLNSAREIYRTNIAQVENTTRLIATRRLIISALAERDTQFLNKELPRLLSREKLDMLTIADPTGLVIARGRNPIRRGDILAGDLFVKRALTTKRIVSGTDIVPAVILELESTQLAAQARMVITPTLKARTPSDTVESSGLMLRAAVPMFDIEQQFVGVLLAGVLLNRNFEIVDKIKNVVHEAEVYKGRDIGTATIFLNDLRVSTNVRNQDGTRAITTLVSDEVRDAVLVRGERYVGEAFVVNSWYLSAYEPIYGIDGAILGILYVGVLKQAFDDILRNTLMTFLGIALLGVTLVIGVAIYLAKRISRPLRRIEDMADRIAGGDYKQEIRVKAPREIERLACSLDKMAKQLESERKELEEWGSKLENKVEERTEEIKKIHSHLFRSEKLASIGKLAAGVAHEINNPLTGILTNSSLMLEDMPADDPRREDVEVIVKETTRCREIVKRLLDFARQSQPHKKLTNINTLIENIVLLVRNQATFRNVEIRRSLTPRIPSIMIDPDQIQQVFVNLVLNAAEAMIAGGKLTIESTISSGGDEIVVRFTDSGPGIPHEISEKIFDPFFTTKEHGTGLGLSISYGIVEQHGGSIEVNSVRGAGSTFTIHLPVNGEPHD